MEYCSRTISLMAFVARGFACFFRLPVVLVVLEEVLSDTLDEGPGCGEPFTVRLIGPGLREDRGVVCMAVRLRLALLRVVVFIVVLSNELSSLLSPPSNAM